MTLDTMRTPMASTSRLAPDRSMPAYLITGALLFWGVHTGLWWLAALLALLAELPGHKHWHWEFELQERQRVADLCTVLILFAGGYLYLTQPRLGAALILLIQWLPALVFPLLAVQLYGRHAGLELSVLFLSLRGDKPHGNELLDLRWAYVLLCVVSASMIPPETIWFYPSLVLLAFWGMSSLFGSMSRSTPGAAPTPGRRRNLQRLGALALAATIGLGFSVALRWGHDEIELMVQRWIDQWMGTMMDPYRATTAIGEVGTLKSSDDIRVRVYPDRPIQDMLLQTAVYDRYINGTWFASGAPFEPLNIRLGNAEIAAPPVNPTFSSRESRILVQIQRSEGLLPLPMATNEIKGLTAIKLQRNAFGTVRYRVLGGGAFVGFRVAEGSRPLPSVAPDAIDLRVLDAEQEMMAQVVAELQLTELPPSQALQRLQAYFDSRFRYTLTLPRIPADQPPLSYFLSHARAGHCEYFASAAVLLLRQAGIPARYVRGWSVQEYSALEQAWIGRDSHAHAWVLAWIDGAWRSFDPTPPDWAALEMAERPWTLTYSDFIAWLRLTLSGATSDERDQRNWLLLPLTVLILLLAWRIARRARRGRRHRETPLPQTAMGGAFTAIELAANKHGLGRRSTETLREWAERIDTSHADRRCVLRDAVQLHYRNRFDPFGLDAGQRKRLDNLLAACLRHWR
ncbi:MAG TPA: hypothetical protein DIW77_07520 [Chromatiaceae bacterium]|nr:hypothetical protein [Chromatiaceae bacterium]